MLVARQRRFLVENGALGSNASSLLSRVEKLLRVAERIVADARIERDWVAATGALREARNCVELLARLRGELESGGGVQIGVAVNVAGAVHASSEELDRMIAVRVSEATGGFNPEEIERLKEIAETSTSGGRSPKPLLKKPLLLNQDLF